jgi:hypothetical protein
LQNDKKIEISKIFTKTSILRVFLLAYSLYLLKHFTGSNNDFRVFYQASYDLVHGISPWTASNDPNTSYLYGPLTTLLLAPISFVNIDVAVFFLRTISILSLWIVAYKLDFPQLRKNRDIYFAILLLSMSTTANLFYGQLQIPIFCGFIYIASNLLKNTKSPAVTFFISFIACLMLDQKPHIAIFALILLIKFARYMELKLILLIELLAGVFVSFQIGTIWFFDYLDAINFRLESARNGRDSMAFTSILSEFGLSLPKILLVLIFTIGIILAFRFKDLSGEEILLVIPVFLLIFTPLLHASDVMFIVPLVVFMIDKELHGHESTLRFLLISCLFTWSNQIEIAIIYGMLAFILVTYVNKSRGLRCLFDFLFCLIPCLSVPLVFHFDPTYEGQTRHFVSYLALPISLYLYFNLKPMSKRAKK